MKKRGVPILIVLILIFLIGAVGVGVSIIKKHTPTKERMDAAQYFQEPAEGELPLIFGTELLEERGKLVDGEVYLPQETVASYLNKRFYWDSVEKKLIYTTPDSIITVNSPDSDVYYIGKKEQKAEGNCYTIIDDQVYLNLKFVQQYTDLEANLYEDPSRLVVQYQFTDVSVVTAKEDTEVRYRGGIKSEILTDVKSGAEMRLIEELETWDQVATADGFIGYIEKKAVGQPSTENYDRDFVQPEYTSIQKEYPINLAWHQVTSQEGNATLDDAVKDMSGVTVISPTWFSVKDNEGNITSLANKEYVAKAHSKKLEVWGLIDNFSDEISTEKVLKATTSRRRLISQLMKQVKNYSLDGINVDFETLTEEEGPHFIQFLRELSIQCSKAQVVLSVDNPVPEEFTSHYDRKEQGNVVDYVIIMGYDEHYNGSEQAGSVASLPWVEEGIQETLKEVPAQKVINAIPFYTRVWKTSMGVVTSEAVGMDVAAKFVAEKGIETYWDENSSQNYGKYEEGNDLYEVWLEDEKSIAEKVKLIPKYQLAGVAEWKLGFERPGVWKVISKSLQG